MSPDPAAPPRALAPAKPASTVILIRDGDAGLEVFLVQRHHQIDFASGAMVFPGGKLEPSDSDPALRGLCAGAEGLDDYALALRVAAIRESFEECGVLLARPAGSSALVTASRLADLWKRHRNEGPGQGVAIGSFARDEGLVLACDLLVPFAHWITPEMMPKRFDTHFFLVEAPPAQATAHDGYEAVDARWLRPVDALAEADAGRSTIIFPTRMNIAKLARSARVADAMASARASRIVTVMPRVERGANGPVLRIPEAAGYDVVEAPLEGLQRA